MAPRVTPVDPATSGSTTPQVPASHDAEDAYLDEQVALASMRQGAAVGSDDVSMEPQAKASPKSRPRTPDSADHDAKVKRATMMQDQKNKKGEKSAPVAFA